jgi:pimeloyl-ACP methyl ester carboxylesterase
MDIKTADINTARNGDVEIAYEAFGAPDGIPLVLIPGSGMQMGMWPEDLCTALAERGFQVARMDNRDSGLSTRLSDYDGLPWSRQRHAYTIRDMADDVIAVVDALGDRGAYLMGGSLGAAIAQVAAINHPDRAAGLVLLSAAPGAWPWLSRPKIHTMIKMLRIMHGDPLDAEAQGQKYVDLQQLVGSPAYPVDEEHWRAAGRLAYERGVYPQGSGRHTAAYLGIGDLRPHLRGLAMPTLVVQGQADPVQSWRAGRAMAAAIPGAQFLLFSGVGHDLPREIWPTVIDNIAALAARAVGRSAG